MSLPLLWTALVVVWSVWAALLGWFVSIAVDERRYLRNP